MISANTVKYLRSLHQGKFRQKYNNFVAEGNKCVSEFLNKGRYPVEALYVLPAWVERNAVLYERYNTFISVIDAKIMKKITHLSTATDILMVAKREEKAVLTGNAQQDILYLDAIQNPGNMGTILRTADWYGIHQVVCSSDCVDFYHPKVVQAAMGSHNAIDHYEMPLDQVKQICDLPAWGMALDGVETFDSSEQNAKIVVIGNEGKGIRPEYHQLLDQKIRIAGSPNRVAESLNAGIATAVILDRLCGNKV